MKGTKCQDYPQCCKHCLENINNKTSQHFKHKLFTKSLGIILCCNTTITECLMREYKHSKHNLDNYSHLSQTTQTSGWIQLASDIVYSLIAKINRIEIAEIQFNKIWNYYSFSRIHISISVTNYWLKKDKSNKKEQ